MQNAVLDSYAILAFLFKENGHQVILKLFEKAIEADEPLLIAAPNWAEVRYIVERKVGFEKWKETRNKLLGLPIEIVDADQELSELAGAIKVQHKMSLADCFAAALVKQQNTAIYTGDPEFHCIESEVKIVWL